jgi:signal transduction histidine kinase
LAAWRGGKPLSGLGIRARLLIVVVATLCLFGVATAIVLAALNDVNNTYEQLLDVDERVLLDATRLRLLAEIEVSTAQSLADPGALETILTVNREQTRVLDELDDLAQTQTDRAMLRRIRAVDLTYDQLVQDAADALRAGNGDIAVGLILQLDGPRRAFLDACDAFISAKTASRDAARAVASTRLRQTELGLLALLALGGGAGAAVVLWVGGRFASGVLGIAAVVRRLAAGDLDASIPRELDDGELAALIDDVEALRSSLRIARDAEEVHRTRVQLVRDAGRALLAAPDLTAALEFLAERAGRALGAARARAVLVDRRDDRVVAAATYGMDLDREPDALATFAPDDGPLRGELRVWAAVGRDLADDEVELLDAVAVEAGLALRNAALAEAASRRAAELDDFVRVVAHDVRGPVALAQRLADLIRSRNPILAATEAPLFARLGDATAFAEGLIDDLRELVRAGRVPSRREPVWLGGVLDDVLAGLSTLLAERGVVVERPTTDVAVLADRRQLRQLLGNLIENAARHMGETSGQPQVELCLVPADDWCRIGVLDNGRGVPEDQRELVFLPFRRAGSDGVEEPGMGMGLAIARRIAESHGGTIWIERAPAGGAAVWFTMPLAVGEIAVESPVSAEPAESRTA